MSYIVHQKVKGKTYAYDTESFWDKKKKQPRQRRRYLGVVDDKTGKIIEKQYHKDIKTAKDFGPGYLLDAIAAELDLRKKLTEFFANKGDEILAMAMTKMIRPDSLKNIHHILDNSFIPQMYSLESSFESQEISRLLDEVGRNENAITSFYASLIQKTDEALVYDITSLSSYSKHLDWLEYGYNRDNMDLPQVNLGLVVSLIDKMPLLLKLFPGSITDVVTLKNLAEEIKALGIRNCMFILDRGFYSEGNIEMLTNAGIEFIMPLPFGRKIGKGLISETNSSILNADNARMFKNDIYHVIEEEVEISRTKLHGIIIFNKKRESDEHQSFYRRLIEIEQILEGRKVWHGNPMQYFEEVAKQFSHYFECSVKDRVIHLKRKQKAIAQQENRFGKMILLSSKLLPWDEVLSLYRERDEAEKQFHQLKNELGLLPLRVRKMETLRGLLFIFYVSLVIRSQLLNRASKANLLKKSSVDDIIFEMSKIRAVQTGDKWLLTEIPKKCRIMLEKLEISVPVVVRT